MARLWAAYSQKHTRKEAIDKMEEKTGYIYLGSSPATDRENYAIMVPYPDEGKAPFETSRMVDSARNANGEVVGRMVGRSVHKQSLAWSGCEIS